MQTKLTEIDEVNAAAAFNEQSIVFDKTYAANKIVTYKRNRVRAVLKKYLPLNSTILELNSGTGDDAIWLANEGHTVHATDIAEGMQEILKQKVFAAGLAQKITTEKCSFTNLDMLTHQRTYDCIFSNFAGLNCAKDLSQVLIHFNKLLKPNGVVILVVMPKFSLWEFLLCFKGEFKLAFRRLTSTSKRGAKAHILGQYFRCWYYNPLYIKKCLQENFKLLQLEGMCTIVPPSFIENFPLKYPKCFSVLTQLEDALKTVWPFTAIGDYYIISLKKEGLVENHRPVFQP